MPEMHMSGVMILGGILVQIIALILFMWVLYLVIRAGVRDGIDQSILGQQALRNADARRRTEPTL